MPTVALALRVAASAEFRSASWQVTRKQETDRNGGPVGLKFLFADNPGAAGKPFAVRTKPLARRTLRV